MRDSKPRTRFRGRALSAPAGRAVCWGVKAPNASGSLLEREGCSVRVRQQVDGAPGGDGSLAGHRVRVGTASFCRTGWRDGWFEECCCRSGHGTCMLAPAICLAAGLCMGASALRDPHKPRFARRQSRCSLLAPNNQDERPEPWYSEGPGLWEPMKGFEPPTRRLRSGCSTTELHRRATKYTTPCLAWTNRRLACRRAHAPMCPGAAAGRASAVHWDGGRGLCQSGAPCRGERRRRAG
jgi:hypothetical protein